MGVAESGRPGRPYNVAGLGSESAEQQAFFAWWNAVGYRLAPGALMFAIPNGGKRGRRTAARLKQEGVLAGVPDIFLAWSSGGYHGLFIEMKRARPFRSHVERTQRDIMAALEAAGYLCFVARGYKEARRLVTAYLALDRARSE